MYDLNVFIMINVSDLVFSYGKKQVFSGLSFSVPRGSVCGLLGENGVGKSTLLNLLVGALLARGGSISVNGFNAGDRCAAMFADMYYITDGFDVPNMKLKDFVKAYAPFYERFSSQRMDECVEAFKLNYNDKMNKMSMGNKKKSLIAFGYATCPRLFLLDEPTNGLDIPSQGVFRSLVSRMSSEGVTVLVSTHQIRDVEQLLDRVLIFGGNELIVNASVDEIEEKLYFAPKHKISEPIFTHGSLAMRQNEGGEESTVNLELLFNAVASDKEGVKRIFNK